MTLQCVRQHEEQDDLMVIQCAVLSVLCGRDVRHAGVDGVPLLGIDAGRVPSGPVVAGIRGFASRFLVGESELLAFGGAGDVDGLRRLMGHNGLPPVMALLVEPLPRGCVYDDRTEWKPRAGVGERSGTHGRLSVRRDRATQNRGAMRLSGIRHATFARC